MNSSAIPTPPRPNPEEEVARLHELLEAMSVVAFDWHIREDRIWLGPGYERWQGLAGQPPTIAFSALRTLMHPHDHHQWASNVEQFLKHPNAQLDLNMRLQDQQCEWRWLEVLGKPVAIDETGTPTRLMGSIRDVTDAQRTRQSLSESQKQFMGILEQSPHAMYRYNYRKNHFDYVSEGFARTIGISREQLLHDGYMDFTQRIHQEDAERLQREFAEALRHSKGHNFTWSTEFRLRTERQGYIWVSDTITVVLDAQGAFDYIVGFGGNIHARKLLEEELKRTNESLENVVAERTQELSTANRRLLKEIRHRHRIEAQMIRLAEHERRSIGQELHDGLCQELTGLRHLFEAEEIHLRKTAPLMSERLKDFRLLLADSILHARDLSHGLCPVAIDPEALPGALRALSARTGRLFGIDCRFLGDEKVRVPDPSVALHFYRITQEAIANAVKHGRAQTIQITLARDPRGLSLTIDNDGAPFRPRRATEGIGLKTMKSRAEIMNGHLRVTNLANLGVRLRCHIPATRRKGTRP